ncbi:uncharacterized protein [Dendrobates tinctorius]|uniref:uncharacterized protein n=1 Tax=Dendrobates tinctorius TaxID=92724 RepID=UPI003CCA4913
MENPNLEGVNEQSTELETQDTWGSDMETPHGQRSSKARKGITIREKPETLIADYTKEEDKRKNNLLFYTDQLSAWHTTLCKHYKYIFKCNTNNGRQIKIRSQADDDTNSLTISLYNNVMVSTISDPLREDLLQKRIFLIYPSRMDMDRDKMAERMLHLTLEILFRLTGEDYTVVKKTSSDRCQDPVSEGWGRPLSPITGPPPHPLIHEDINDQKILELIYKMIELLTGEVPIRCQDVAVYFSMEEWEYLEGHRYLYKNVIMEVPQPLTSPDLSSKRTTPERCPRPLLPQDCKQEDPSAPQDHQGEDLTPINPTETYVRDDERCKEEIPTYDYPEPPALFQGSCIDRSGIQKSVRAKRRSGSLSS